MARKIFVSYVERDRTLVDHAVQHLRRKGLLRADDEIAIDREAFTAGADLRQATRQLIDAADSVLVIWSPAAATSKWVNYELGMADALDKRVLAVTLRGQAADFPPGLESTQIIEMPTPKAGYYEIKSDERGQFSFVLKGPNDKGILFSESYASKSSALNGVAAAQANSSREERYEVKQAKDGQHFFNLKAANHQVIGTSPLYTTAKDCEAGLRLVRENGALAELKDSS